MGGGHGEVAASSPPWPAPWHLWNRDCPAWERVVPWGSVNLPAVVVAWLWVTARVHCSPRPSNQSNASDALGGGVDSSRWRGVAGFVT